MKAARLYEYDAAMNVQLKIENVREPTIMKPDEVVVKVGAAGLCRTDLHIIEGVWQGDHGHRRHPPALHHGSRERRLGRGRRQRGDVGQARRRRDLPPVAHLRHLPVNCRYGEDMHCDHSACSRAWASTAASRSTFSPMSAR